ncbi:hypothetical protein VP01_4046g1 [Puccinia sorghi]|uniref:Uncharacterized protein n=1 Tax=Puccinia sorghi TaxID=27349 RepID=A0A0L6USJ1_9BASI|nr:hypothetical protein VP01_4046g1 [Puccinia sorghi]
MRNENTDLLPNDAAERNGHPDIRLRANVTKLISSLKKQVIPQDKHQDQSMITRLQVLIDCSWKLDPCCPQFLGTVTLRYLFNFCPTYKIARQSLRAQAAKNKIGFSWNNPHSLLKNPKSYSLVVAFLKTLGRFTLVFISAYSLCLLISLTFRFMQCNGKITLKKNGDHAQRVFNYFQVKIAFKLCVTLALFHFIKKNVSLVYYVENYMYIHLSKAPFSWGLLTKAGTNQTCSAVVDQFLAGLIHDPLLHHLPRAEGVICALQPGCILGMVILSWLVRVRLSKKLLRTYDLADTYIKNKGVVPESNLVFPSCHLTCFDIKLGMSTIWPENSFPKIYGIYLLEYLLSWYYSVFFIDLIPSIYLLMLNLSHFHLKVMEIVTEKTYLISEIRLSLILILFLIQKDIFHKGVIHQERDSNWRELSMRNRPLNDGIDSEPEESILQSMKSKISNREGNYLGSQLVCLIPVLERRPISVNQLDAEIQKTFFASSFGHRPHQRCGVFIGEVAAAGLSSSCR